MRSSRPARALSCCNAALATRALQHEGSGIGLLATRNGRIRPRESPLATRAPVTQHGEVVTQHGGVLLRVANAARRNTNPATRHEAPVPGARGVVLRTGKVVPRSAE